jgi:hypothetical protein
MAELDTSTLNNLIEAVDRPDCLLVLPERIESTYRMKAADGSFYMIFPFVGKLSNYFPSFTAPAAISNPLEVATDFALVMQDMPPGIVDAMRSKCPSVSARAIYSLEDRWSQKLVEAGVMTLCLESSRQLEGYDRRLENTVIHSDLQLGNMITDSHGRPRVVDMDLMRTGTLYSDLITCAIYNGAEPDQVRNAIAKIRNSHCRSPDKFDVAFSVCLVVVWFRTITSMYRNEYLDIISTFIDGLKTIRELDI